jgi:hypothetical protein
MARDERNSRNPAAPLFKRLTRLLSGPIINYRTQIARQERRGDLDKYRYRFRSMSGQEFKRSDNNFSQNYNLFTSAAFRNQNRAERYIDFEQMEYMPEIASAMDIYADEMTTSDEYDQLISITCMNLEIKTILHSLFYDVLNIEFNAFGWCRSMCKYGDFFLYMDVDDKIGVTAVMGLPNNEIERLEGQDPTNPNYIQYQWNGAGMTFENWQIAHFRILGNDRHAPYGTSVLDPARRIWRQLVLLEDAMIAYRVVRAPERRVFKIDVGNIPPQDVPQYMEKVKTEMKRNSLVDSNTGRVDLRYNPLSLEEDYFIPMRGGVGSDIVSLPGAKSLDDIEDVKYMRDKMFAAIKIPQAYLTNLEGADEDKTTLAQKDIRFARTIQRLQRSVVSELEKIAVVHLYTLGFRGEDLISFSLSLNNPSRLAELQQLEYMRTKFDVANAVPEGTFSKRWVSHNILGLSDEEILRNQREAFQDRKYQQALETVTEQGAEDILGGDLTGGLGADLGGDLGAGAGDLGGELEGELGTPEGAEETGETALLQAPGRRGDGSAERQYEKGKYKPVLTRGGDRRRLGKSGPRRRSEDGTKPEAALGRTPRTRRPAGYVTVPEINSPAMIGMEENKQSIYNNSEHRLIESTQTIRRLIEEMEKKEVEKDET